MIKSMDGVYDDRRKIYKKFPYADSEIVVHYSLPEIHRFVTRLDPGQLMRLNTELGGLLAAYSGSVVYNGEFGFDQYPNIEKSLNIVAYLQKSVKYGGLSINYQIGLGVLLSAVVVSLIIMASNTNMPINPKSCTLLVIEAIEVIEANVDIDSYELLSDGIYESFNRINHITYSNLIPTFITLYNKNSNEKAFEKLIKESNEKAFEKLLKEHNKEHAVVWFINCRDDRIEDLIPLCIGRGMDPKFAASSENAWVDLSKKNFDIVKFTLIKGQKNPILFEYST